MWNKIEEKFVKCKLSKIKFLIKQVKFIAKTTKKTN